MNLISLDFITFAIITLIVYFFVPKKYRWLVLAISSIRFYYVAGIKALMVLVVASLGTFFSAIIIERIPVGIKKRKILLATSVMLIAMWLMFTKASRIDGVHFHLSVVPLGISYVSFMLISYLVDIYWEKDCSDKNFFRFKIQWWMQISFYTYAIHSFILHWEGKLIKLSGIFAEEFQYSTVSIRFALLWRLSLSGMTFVLVALSAYILIRFAPRVYELLSGGRVPKEDM